MYSFPADPYPYTDSNFWPDGPGQMTRYGKQQLFLTGQRLRSKYRGFISANYFPNETRAEANPSNRVYDALACLLAGLYPPLGYQLWNPAVLWQPIYIHFVPDLTVDMMLHCPAYRADVIAALDRANAQNGTHDRLLKFISDHTDGKVNTLQKIAMLYDTFVMNSENGYELPEWTAGIFPEKMAPIYADVFAASFAASPLTIRLTAGPTLEKINDQISAKAAGRLFPNLRMNIMASHDSIIIVVLNALGIYWPRIINTSGYLVFELHETSRGQFVQVQYYDDSSMVTPHTMTIPSCGHPCPIEQFSKIVSLLKVNDTWALCNETFNGITQSELIPDVF